MCASVNQDSASHTGLQCNSTEYNSPSFVLSHSAGRKHVPPCPFSFSLAQRRKKVRACGDELHVSSNLRCGGARCQAGLLTVDGVVGNYRYRQCASTRAISQHVTWLPENSPALFAYDCCYHHISLSCQGQNFSLEILASTWYIFTSVSLHTTLYHPLLSKSSCPIPLWSPLASTPLSLNYIFPTPVL